MSKKTAQGFTLIEVMIVLVIVSILASIALPSYQDSIRKARRSDATIALEKAAAIQEQHFFTKSTYSSDIDDIGGSGGTLSSPEGFYLITTSVAAAATGCSTDGVCYLLTATATGVQADDSECATFTLTNTGARASTSRTDCW
ncbi:MAG: prepilin-type N-terminal cleavage/methylation domain-containing protein [Oceanicoccus sp.]|uniref:type IV pilin protein n=1 Tax=Oceanicoccus sp. TaxID=2691044 RepID=UPI0026349581|nr:type IV pilin protein [Oceanicoccus sp.]MCP3908002.1 prepilin-type N-terminal cleavage/methylation domain-containing protein [Oceanicoccus sp.]MDG1773476.1 type IV pilin protein [Oceanicoccus sp.]